MVCIVNSLQIITVHSGKIGPIRLVSFDFWKLAYWPEVVYCCLYWVYFPPCLFQSFHRVYSLTWSVRSVTLKKNTEQTTQAKLPGPTSHSKPVLNHTISIL